MADIKVARLADHPEFLYLIVQWVHDQWSKYSGRTYEETQAQFEHEGRSDELPVSLIAIEDECVIGLISLREKETIDHDPLVSPWLSNVYVTEDARGKNVASKLCKAMEGVAKEMGFYTIYLGCEIESDSLYHRLGYQEYNRTHHQNQTAYLLRLNLD